MYFNEKNITYERLMKNLGKMQNDHPLNHISTFDLNMRFSEWSRINLRTIDENELQNKLLKTLSSLSISSSSLTNQEFYRVRKINDLNDVKTKSDVWYTPKKYVQKMGRINLPNESRLYCSFDKVTPILECNIKPGDNIALISYRLKESSSLQLTNVVNESYPPNLNDNGKIVHNMINTFIRNEFTKPVGVGTEYLYRVSNRICVDFMDIPNCDGFIYPSIATFSNTFNIALKSESVDQHVLFKSVEILQITEINEVDYIVNFNRLAYSETISNNELLYI